MLKNFMNSVEIARKQINDYSFMFTNRIKSTYFTKDTAKMSFKDAIYFILKGLRKTLQIEIDDWFEFIGGDNTMTKQAFSQLRQKIKPDAFMSMAKSEANENVELKKKDIKYEYKVNMNILISKMTKTLIECFYEEDMGKRTILFDKAIKNITKNLVPIRPGRSFPRKEPSRKNKYPVNKKRSV